MPLPRMDNPLERFAELLRVAKMVREETNRHPEHNDGESSPPDITIPPIHYSPSK
jgi:hypothetical protein